MKKIGIAVMILAVIGVAVAAGVFVTGHPETTKVEQKHEKIKKEGKAYAGKYRMNILLDTNNKVLSGTVRATLKNATDDDYLRAQLGSRYFAGENEPEKESVQN